MLAGASGSSCCAVGPVRLLALARQSVRSPFLVAVAPVTADSGISSAIGRCVASLR